VNQGGIGRMPLIGQSGRPVQQQDLNLRDASGRQQAAGRDILLR
jgi:hypothetical protein